jgi:hypothetical protein
MIFMTAHPSEWNSNEVHISVIELQHDVKLLFMITLIKQLRIFSSLGNILGSPGNNMRKMKYDNIKQWIPHLEREGLDGWFSSIENKGAVEFAVINRPDTLKIVECLPVEHDWNNTGYSVDGNIVPKKWGSIYPIFSKSHHIKFILNSRFKPQIEQYLRILDEEGDAEGTALAVLLRNAEITYFDADIHYTKWS